MKNELKNARKQLNQNMMFGMIWKQLTENLFGTFIKWWYLAFDLVLQSLSLVPCSSPSVITWPRSWKQGEAKGNALDVRLQCERGEEALWETEARTTARSMQF